MKYNWQQPDWPGFTYDIQDVEDSLFSFAEETGYVSGMLNTGGGIEMEVWEQYPLQMKKGSKP